MSKLTSCLVQLWFNKNWSNTANIISPGIKSTRQRFVEAEAQVHLFVQSDRHVYIHPGLSEHDAREFATSSPALDEHLIPLRHIWAVFSGTSCPIWSRRDPARER